MDGFGGCGFVLVVLVVLKCFELKGFCWLFSVFLWFFTSPVSFFKGSKWRFLLPHLDSLWVLIGFPISLGVLLTGSYTRTCTRKPSCKSCRAPTTLQEYLARPTTYRPETFRNEVIFTTPNANVALLVSLAALGGVVKCCIGAKGSTHLFGYQHPQGPPKTFLHGNLGFA